MNDSQTSETLGIVPQETGATMSLDDFKSLFYRLNAKPDTEIRLLPGKKTLELADIRSINEQIAAKLRNHDITADVISINFILSNKKIKDYSTETLQKVFIFLAAFFMAGLFAGFKIERFIDKRINKFEEYPRFSITRGDGKAIEEFEKVNDKLNREIVSRIFWILFTMLVSSSLKLIINYIVP